MGYYQSIFPFLWVAIWGLAASTLYFWLTSRSFERRYEDAESKRLERAKAADGWYIKYADAEKENAKLKTQVNLFKTALASSDPSGVIKMEVNLVPQEDGHFKASIVTQDLTSRKEKETK
jgi:hypothetical protein